MKGPREATKMEMVTAAANMGGAPIPNSRMAKIAASLHSGDNPLLPKTMRWALKQTDGNIAMAAKKLAVSVSRLDKEIQLHGQLYEFLKEIRASAPRNSEYRKMTLTDIEEDIQRNAVLYRAEALESLHDLAMMPITSESNSALAQVKLLAAQRLYQETGDRQVGSEIDSTLRILNDRYHDAAPRIKSIRERTITFEEQPRLVEGVVQDVPAPE